MTGLLGAAQQRDVLPGQGCQPSAQVLLVSLDDHDVVGLAAQQVGGVLALDVHRIGGDHRPGQVGDGVQKALESGDLVGLLTDVHLGRPQLR
ncbi:hypothetical protein [Streptomyces sp. XH2]|uniref:hypothetical protein n=1 Tax=Streptomyces sp. XH2 TaxID=3412483 RepID=UPI003C7E92FB